MNKHNSDCKPDRGYYKGSPYLTPFESNRTLRLLYYTQKRKLDKDIEFINWCLKEGKKIRGIEYE